MFRQRVWYAYESPDQVVTDYKCNGQGRKTEKKNKSVKY